MRVVYRYDLGDQSGFVRCYLPKRADVIDFQYQPHRKKFCVWAIVNPNFVTVEEHLYHIVATGQELPVNVNLKYLHTTHMYTAQEVWHLFEER